VKDWYTVQPDVVKLMNKHFTKGRTRKLRYITLHHMAGVGDVAQYGVNVRTHDEFYGTSCPYHLRPGHKYHDEYIARAGEWYDDMTQNPHPKETDTMALNDTEQQQLNRIEDQQVEILKQLGQPGGWPQGGDRTLYDLTAAVAEVEGVPNTRDTLA